MILRQRMITVCKCGAWTNLIDIFLLQITDMHMFSSTLDANLMPATVMNMINICLIMIIKGMLIGLICLTMNTSHARKINGTF